MHLYGFMQHYFLKKKTEIFNSYSNMYRKEWFH